MLHSLLQLTTPQMKFQVTEIEFDFEMEDDEYPSDDYQHALTEETIGQIWDAEDEDDLVEEITCATGWCIKSIDYRHILN
jgi:hypothetical protein